MCACVCISGYICSHAHTLVHLHARSTAVANFYDHACVNSDSTVFDLFYMSWQFLFTMIVNDTQRLTLEATNVPVSQLTRSATHVSNNQATFQPLDSGDPSTLLSLSAHSLLLLSAACSSERSEQLTKTLYNKTLYFHSHHSIKAR